MVNKRALKNQKRDLLRNEDSGMMKELMGKLGKNRVEDKVQFKSSKTEPSVVSANQQHIGREPNKSSSSNYRPLSEPGEFKKN